MRQWERNTEENDFNYFHSLSPKKLGNNARHQLAAKITALPPSAMNVLSQELTINIRCSLGLPGKHYVNRKSTSLAQSKANLSQYARCVVESFNPE